MAEEGYDFECQILELRSNWLGDKNQEVRHAYVYVRQDGLVLRKTGVFIKSDLGTKTLYYKDISTLDYDKAGLFHVTSDISITMISGEKVILRYVEEEWFNYINQLWVTYHNNLDNHQSGEVQITPADELLKYAGLYEKGLLSLEEFNKIKAKLLAELDGEIPDEGSGLNEDVLEVPLIESDTLQSEIPVSDENDTPKFCSKCGTPVEKDYIFCVSCGEKLR